MKAFKIQAHDRWDKRFEITGPDGFRMFVDNDDVDHREVAKVSKKLVAVLNENWPEQY